MMKAFTLIEIIIAVSLIAVFVTLPVLAYGSFTKTSRDTQRKNDMNKIQSALEFYRAGVGKYPAAANWEQSLIDGGYMPSVPEDPRDGESNGRGGVYGYFYSISEDEQSYQLSGLLEKIEGTDTENSIYVVTPEGTKVANVTPGGSTFASPTGQGNTPTAPFTTNSPAP